MEKDAKVLASVLIVVVIAYLLSSLMGVLPSQYDAIRIATSTWQMWVNILGISVLTIVGVAINKQGGWRRD